MDGAFQALDHVANWVRFADVKATLLTAGLGVVLTMLMTNSRTVYVATTTGCQAAYVVGALTTLVGCALLYTLFWLARAVRPNSGLAYSTLNRFAWPSLTETTAAALTAHTANNDHSPEAWQQVADLSRIADRKFTACRHAVGGFIAFVLLGVACVSAATVFTA